MKPKLSKGLIGFGLFWTAFTLLFDCFVVHSVTMRLWALSFSSTTGTVIHSELKTSPDSDGETTYQPEVHYHYSVEAAAHTGTTYQFSQFLTSSSRRARSVVRAHPIGKPVTVFYNPQNPSQAVLHRGLDGSELFMVVFMTPFNAVMVAFWGGVVRWRKQPQLLASGGVEAVVRGCEVVVRLPHFPPAAVGGILAAVVAFALTLLIAFTAGMDPSLRVGASALGLVVGSGVAAALFVRLQEQRGRFALAWDNAFQTLTLPANFERKARRTVPFRDLRAVEVEVVWPKDRTAESIPSYAATLVLANAQRELLEEWNQREPAERFATWLSQQLGLKPPLAAA
jgi:hypothetical protein